MTREELERLRDSLQNEVARRRGLGEYSQEAGAILFLYEAVSRLADHLAAKKK